MTDENKTHILGHIINYGTHTEGVCADHCWCKKDEDNEY